MSKVVKEFLLDQATGMVYVEYDDNSTISFQLADAITADYGVANSVKFNTEINSFLYQEGLLFYDNEDHSLAYYNDDSDIKVNIGREQLIRVYNNTGSTLLNGKIVYVNGANTGWPTVALAQANTKLAAVATIGMVTADILSGEHGYVCTSGTVHNVDTSSYPPGTALYLSASVAGGYTNIAPIQPNYEVEIGKVVMQGLTTGDIFIEVDRKDWHPSIQIMDTSTTVVLPTTPTVFKPPTTSYNDGFTYSSTTGELTFDNNGSYTVVLQINAQPSASNKYIYFYVEEDTGSGWVINRYTARKLELVNATEQQMTITATRYFAAGSKIRHVLWGDATVTLRSTDLLGTTAGTVTLPAFRWNVA